MTQYNANSIEKKWQDIWEKNNIFPKHKDVSIAQLVSETILTLRCYLIDKKVNEIKEDVNKDEDHRALLEDVLNYSNLKMLLSRKCGYGVGGSSQRMDV